MKIGIAGLGLIGGSILKALKRKINAEFFVFDNDENTLNESETFGAKASKDIKVLNECDFVFVCTPMSKTEQTLNMLEVQPDCIVTDVSSVKRFVAETENKFTFIPSHPMAGTEKQGFNSSFPEMFEGKNWIICADKNLPEVKKLSEIIELTGAKIIFTTPEEHDYAVALISHLPIFIAKTLVQTAQDNALALKTASSGFKDTTRVAKTNPVLANDMLKYNKDNILKALKIFKQHLDKFESSITE